MDHPERAGAFLSENRTGRYRLHSLIGLLRRPVFCRLAEYEDVNDTDRLVFDPVIRQIVGRRVVDASAASTSPGLASPRSSGTPASCTFGSALV